MTKIFLDPGHGGHDPGAVANGLQEKNIVLNIAKRIEKLLQAYEGVQVRLSRSDDRFLELAERARLANQWGADYFVSIHINAGGGTGYEDFIYNGSVSSATVANQNVMNAEIVKATGFANRGKKRANLAVLRSSNMPAILTESGFIDNAKDAQLLKQSAFTDKIAQGHVNGLVKIFGLKKKAVAITAPPAQTQPTGPYKDVPANHWAVDAIRFVKDSGLMVGHTDGTFAANETVTRVQLAQVLYNMNKK